MCPPPDANSSVPSRKFLSLLLLPWKCRVQLALQSSEGMAFWGYSKEMTLPCPVLWAK